MKRAGVDVRLFLSTWQSRYLPHVPDVPVSASVRLALAHFEHSAPMSIEPLGEGHIHATYLVKFPEGSPSALVLQRVNTHVFPDVASLMRNLVRVTEHARQRLQAAGVSELNRRVLCLRRTLDGSSYLRDSEDQVYRAFEYIPEAVALSQIATPRDAYEAGRAVGEFGRLVWDLPGAELAVTIPNFHALEQRWVQLTQAFARDPMGRASRAQAELRALQDRKPRIEEWLTWSGQLPLRIAHNDTKLNNILFDRDSRRALCVIDLDTVMPGPLAFDFGDLVRTCVAAMPEDARDLTAVHVRLDVFEALARGYLSELNDQLTPLERQSLARGPIWIVMELAMRFLADYVSADRYFKVTHPEHNLERAQAQLTLLTELEAHEAELLRIIEAVSPTP